MKQLSVSVSVSMCVSGSSKFNKFQLVCHFDRAKEFSQV